MALPSLKRLQGRGQSAIEYHSNDLAPLAAIFSSRASSASSATACIMGAQISNSCRSSRSGWIVSTCCCPDCKVIRPAAISRHALPIVAMTASESCASARGIRQLAGLGGGARPRLQVDLAEGDAPARSGPRQAFARAPSGLDAERAHVLAASHGEIHHDDAVGQAICHWIRYARQLRP